MSRLRVVHPEHCPHPEHLRRRDTFRQAIMHPTKPPLLRVVCLACGLVLHDGYVIS